MSIAFSRSIRSMNQDSFRPGLVGLSVLLLVLLAWSAWFFLAKIPHYETSRDLQVRRDGMLLVTFSPEALPRILPGQTASLHLASTGEQMGQTFAAEIMNIPTGGRGPVEVYVYSSEALQPGLVGELKVQVETVSPARLVLRSAGQLVDQKK